MILIQYNASRPIVWVKVYRPAHKTEPILAKLFGNGGDRDDWPYIRPSVRK